MSTEALLRERLVFQARLDEFVESVALRRLSLGDALAECLPLVVDATAASRVWLETLDETGEPAVFSVGDEPEGELRALAAELIKDQGPRDARTAYDSETLHARRLDVAGQDYGTLAILVGPEVDLPADERDARVLVAAEVLDNYLASVRHACEKQRLLRQVHSALRNPRVSVGVREAVAHLTETVRFDLLIVIYHLEEDWQDSLHYLVFRGPELEFATRERVAKELDALLSSHSGHPGSEVLIRDAELDHRRVVGEEVDAIEEEDESQELLRRLGYEDYLETILIGGVTDEAPMGKVVVASRQPMSTYERDVFDLFADVLQKRVVDYSRRGHDLHRTFPLPVVVRLLDEPDPAAVLAPRGARVSILYADVSGFTRLSEQILQDPSKVGAFIEAFATAAVRILWKHGGVFDKLVGDCVIGLFGPPYDETTEPQRALACARAALEMSEWTRVELAKHPAAAEIVAAGEPLGVAIGINHCSASVGTFGPNRDFTAFSPGMNNTARLQGLAVRDEVLVLEPMRAYLDEADPGATFSELRTGKAKNVADPLRFFALESLTSY